MNANDAPSTQTYLNHLSSVIARMSDRSSDCKKWCLTLIAALAIFALKEAERAVFLIALLPTGAFYVLDAYYLAIEREFQIKYESFAKAPSGASLFDLKSAAWTERAKGTGCCLFSPSTFLVYVTAAAVLLVAWCRAEQ